jgi:hypothetical protein
MADAPRSFLMKHVIISVLLLDRPAPAMPIHNGHFPPNVPAIIAAQH